MRWYWCGLLTALLAILFTAGARTAEPAATRPWTLESALAQLDRQPHDAYLQYVVLQLAGKASPGKSFEKIAARVEALAGGHAAPSLLDPLANRGAILDALQRTTLIAAYGDGKAKPDRHHQPVAVAKLQGPRLPAHAWQQAPAGVAADNTSSLAAVVPADFWFAEFHSLSRLLELAQVAMPWAQQLPPQLGRPARSANGGNRLRQQLLLEDNPLLRPVLDFFVGEAAFAGSSLPMDDAPDQVVLFRLKQPDLVRPRLDDALKRLAPAGAQRTEGTYRGIPYVELTMPDRAVHVYWAYPKPDLHVRSNSKVSFERVLDVILGPAQDHEPVPRLLDQPDCIAARARLTERSKDDGFVFLSERFLHQQLSPQRRLAQRRQLLCANHLRMIDHAALLYRTQHGQAAESLDQLVTGGCLPAGLADGAVGCPDEGTYALGGSGSFGLCTRHGRTGVLRPCCELPLREVSAEEANLYQQWSAEFEQHWGALTVPLALGVRLTAGELRVEAVTPPLPPSRLTQKMSEWFGGAAEPLDAVAIAPRTVASLTMRLDKEAILRREPSPQLVVIRIFNVLLGIPLRPAPSLELTEFVTKGLGNQVGIHLVDAPPASALPLVDLLVDLLAGGDDQPPGKRRLGPVRIALKALRAPVYLSLPLRDVALADRFLTRLDLELAAMNPPPGRRRRLLVHDFAMSNHPNPIRSYAFGLGPVGLQLFWLRAGNTIYIASRSALLEDLGQGNLIAPAKDGGLVGHAQLRLRLDQGARSLPEFRRSWLDANRAACRANLGPLTDVARGLTVAAEADGVHQGQQVVIESERLFGRPFVCPDGGQYERQADGRIVCSVHDAAEGNVVHPAFDVLCKQFTGASITLNLEPGGPRLRIVLDRARAKE